MPGIGRRLALVVCALLLLAALAVGRLRGGEAPARTASTEPVATAAADLPPAPAAEVAVHVVGAVKQPGVYRLAAGARALDAVRRAGGPTAKADLAGLNLAAIVADGEQVVVPRRGQPVARAPGAPAGPPAVVHLNSADVAALDTLPGIGPAIAARIVAWREDNGGFASVDDLLEVPGLGPTRVEAVRDLVAP